MNAELWATIGTIPATLVLFTVPGLIYTWYALEHMIGLFQLAARTVSRPAAYTTGEAHAAASSSRPPSPPCPARRAYRPARQVGLLVNHLLTPTRVGLVMFVAVAAVFGSLTGASFASGKSKPPPPPSGASFQGLGQMPGVVIQPGSCGTQAFGISGDGNVIVGSGCVGNDEAFRWTVAGGYQRLPVDADG
jgi:hypothetical protein